MTVDPVSALNLTARLAACASFVASLEMFAVRSEFRECGTFNLAISCLYWKHSLSLFQVDQRLSAVLASMAVSSAGLVMLGPFSVAGRIALLTCLVSRFLIRWRRLIGGDGAEQITTIILIAAALAVLPVSSPARVKFAVAFIAAQLVLSYVTAGVAKLSSPVWRSGKALPGIMATHSYGHPVMAGALLRFQRAGLVLGWFVILFECAFPLFLLGPTPLLLSGLSLGLTFHVACAMAMRLNNFLWAFPAAYPRLVVLSDWARSAM